MHASLIPSAIRLALVSTILFAPANAVAQDRSLPVEPTPSTTPTEPSTPRPQNSAEGAITRVSTVSVVGARYDARRDDTASKIVTSRDDLLKYGDTTLADALKRLPGVTVSGSDGISLRGMGNGYTQILVNGQKAPAGLDLASLAPEMVERVEILRSATADLRTEAIAGTINIVLAKTARANTRELKLGLGTSRGQLLPSASWRLSRRDEDRNYTVNASLARRAFLATESVTETARDPAGQQTAHRAGTVRVDGFRDVLSLAPDLNLTPENGDTLSLQGYFNASNYNKYGDIAWTALAGPPRRHSRYHQFTGINVVQLRTDLSWTHEFDAAGKLAAKLSLGGNREKSEFREQGYSADGVHNLDDVTHAELHVQGFSTSGKYSLPAVEDHVPELGWEASLDRRRETRMQRLHTGVDLQESISDLDFDAGIRRLALYAQDDWTMSPHWSLYLGARWERIETTSEGNRFDRIGHDASVLSPLLQSLWKLAGNRNDQIRLGLSRTYKSPALRSLIPRPYTSTNNSALTPDQQGNPGLRPELALGMDLAYERYWDDDASISLGAYAREIDGVIRSETALVNGRWVASPINGGSATTWGIEIDTRFALTQLLTRAPAIDIRFNVTRNWSSVDDIPGPDNRIDKQPRLSSTIAADYTIGPKWTVGGSYNFVSGGPVRATAFEIDHHSTRRVVDVYGLWSLSTDRKLRLSLSDLLQQDVVSTSTYFDRNGSQQIQTRRVSPLVVRANLEIKY